ncbi:cupin-like domain-containing protein [Spirulina sp. 06S082]|uniref:cupin-like domain-containing protein n=1 Tax=Spirulina sp. 06S082 TaxID=3110248 RepID=UPI002B1EC976|nr:cupin-like domain-containing protein [Spirulina sp. 06S082]MEA5471031.1 cupin-like domain-containing protein [Spirulina sp. 06S082]
MQTTVPDELMTVELESRPKLNLDRSIPAIARVSLADLTKKEFVKQYQNPGIPVIMTGLLEGKSRWDLDFLCQKLGDRQFLLRQYGKQRYQQDKRQWDNIGSGVQTERKAFQTYANLLRSGEAKEKDIYLAKCSINETPLKQEKIIQEARQKIVEIGLDKPISHFNIWVGPSSHVECLHYDQMDGTLIQLYGTKKVILFPPSQTPNLYPFSIFVHLYRGLEMRSWFSKLYPEQPDFQAFPNYRKALPYKQEVLLAPGEILYIPAGWWHEVSALGNTLGDDMVCSINRFWRVYPTLRAVFSWNRWRGYLGSAFAVPHLIVSLILAFFSRDREQKIKKIMQML